MKQDSEAADKVSISLKLEGEEAEKFLLFKKAKFVKNNAEVARMLMMPSLEAELSSLSKKPQAKAAA